MGMQRDRTEQADEIALDHFTEGDLPPVRQFVAAGCDQHQAILAERDPLDTVRQRVFGGKPEIGGSGEDGTGDIGAFALLDVDRDVRVLAQENGQCLRQIFRQARRVGEKPDRGLGAACIGQEIAAHRIDIVDHDPRMIEQAFAGRCQLDTAPAARQQRYAERFFQALDALARRGQREMDLCRAIGDAAGLGHRDEELKVDQIETHRKSLRGRHCEPTGRAKARPLTGSAKQSMPP